MNHQPLLNSLFIAVFAITILSCSTPQNVTQSPSQSQGSVLRSTVAYSPKKPTAPVELDKVKSEISEILKRAEILDERKLNLNVSSKEISVLDDKIEIKGKEQTTLVNFSDLIKYTINVKRQYYPNVRVKANSAGTYALWAKVNGKLTEIIYKPFSVQFPTLISFNFGEFNFVDAQKLADNLLIFQNLAIKKQANAQISQFEAIASQYRALKVKPPVSEEQRKYIVQANAFNQEKNYTKAIELYSKAIEMDQTAYPSAYMNLALLSAQVSKFDAAIFNMKKYLLLEPEAKDARSAQDKIYEWEIKLDK